MFEIFCVAEGKFREQTANFANKIDGHLITKSVIEDANVLANFSKLKEKVIDKEIGKNFLEDIIYFYVKTRTFSLVKIQTDSYKLSQKIEVISDKLEEIFRNS